MASNTGKLRLILVALICACSTQLHAIEPNALPPNPLKGELIEHVAVIYSSQVGIREKTNNNDGREVEMYLASAGLTKGQPWCAAFVTWTYKNAGVKALVSGYSPAWFPAGKVIWKNQKGQQPNRADVFGLWFANKGRIAHVGFIDKWDEGNYAVTVEGNTNEGGSRDGDGVYRKRRLKRQIHVISRWL